MLSLSRWFLAFLLLTAGCSSQATEPEREGLGEIQSHHETTVSMAFGLFSESRMAYTSRPASPELASEVFEIYLNRLDSQRMFFTQSDIQAWSQTERMQQALTGEDLSLVREVYERYIDRVEERLGRAQHWLHQDMDFSQEESWVARDENTPWSDEEALDEAWRRYVKNDLLSQRLAGKSIEEARQILTRRYVRVQRRLQGDLNEAVSTYVNAYAAAIDPHTNYFPPVVADEFQMSMSLSMQGIGSVLGEEDEGLVVRSVVPGGPAAKSGQLNTGDRIVGVGQGNDGPMVDVVGWSLEEAVRVIRGPKDTVVRLQVYPVAEPERTTPREIVLVREEIKLEDQAAQSSVVEIEGQKIGVIELPVFYHDFSAARNGDEEVRSATRDVRVLIEELKAQGVEGLVVDLRGNGGGSLLEAIELTGLFIDLGPVVQVREAGGRISVEGDSDAGMAWEGPLAVLVDRQSASASEIFAAAIQDYGRGLIVGEKTYGKGTVQNVMDLDQYGRGRVRYGQMSLTVAQFFRINGGTTQMDGVVPDVQFPVTLNGDRGGEEILPRALPSTRIPSARYSTLTTPWSVEALQASHEARRATSQEWTWWLSDIERFREVRDRREVSLNEAARRAELDATTAQVAERNAIRASLGLPVTGVEGQEDVEANDFVLNETATILTEAMQAIPEGAYQARQRANK